MNKTLNQWAIHGRNDKYCSYSWGITCTSDSTTSCVTLCQVWIPGAWWTQKCSCGQLRVKKQGLRSQ